MTGSKKQERRENKAVKASYIDYNMYATLTKAAVFC